MPRGVPGGPGRYAGGPGAEGARRSGTERARRPRSEAGRAAGGRRRAGLGDTAPGGPWRSAGAPRRSSAGPGRKPGGRRRSPRGPGRSSGAVPAGSRRRAVARGPAGIRKACRGTAVGRRRSRRVAGDRRRVRVDRRRGAVDRRPRVSARAVPAGRPSAGARGSPDDPPAAADRRGRIGRDPGRAGPHRAPPGTPSRVVRRRADGSGGGRRSTAVVIRSRRGRVSRHVRSAGVSARRRHRDPRPRRPWPAAPGPPRRSDRRRASNGASASARRPRRAARQPPEVTRRRQRWPSRVSSTATPRARSSSRSRSDSAQSRFGARRGARVEHRLELGVERRVGRRGHAEHRIEVADERGRATGVGRRQRARIDPPVELADPVEQGAQRRRDVEVVVEPRLEARADRVQRCGERRVVVPILAVRGEGREHGVDPLDRGRRGGERLVGEVQRRAVVDREQRVPDGPRRDAGLDELADPGDVAGRLGHLLAVHAQVRAMQPGAHERLAGGRLRLRDLVLVVRKDEVDPARVDVERGAEVGHAHRGALDVPAGTTRADRRVPRRLAGLGALPQGEVPHVVLAVLVGLHALADAHRVGVEPGEPAVRRPGRDPEEDRPVVGAVRVAAVEQRLDELDDLRDVVGRPRERVRAGHAHDLRVGEEPGRVAVGELPGRDALGGRAADDLVVDVGQVHDPGHGQALVAQVAHQQVGEQERAEVADVGGSVDRRAAAVDADLAGLDRVERPDVARERVLEADGHAPPRTVRDGPRRDRPARPLVTRQVAGRRLDVDQRRRRRRARRRSPPASRRGGSRGAGARR